MGDKGKKDKSGRETKKKAKLSIKEKRKQKKDKGTTSSLSQGLYWVVILSRSTVDAKNLLGPRRERSQVKAENLRCSAAQFDLIAS